MVKVVKELNLDLTPQDLAALFLDLDSAGQAAFFDAVHRIVTADWPHGLAGLAMQLEMVVTPDSGITEEGKRVMEMIGDYGYTCRLVERRHG